MRKIPAIAAALLLVAPPAAASPDRKLLDDVGSSYPRVIRLEHSGAANGTVLATIGTRIDDHAVGLVYRSTDGGETFRKLSTVADPAGVSGQGACCATLYELPRRVGPLAEGTLLWATTAGMDAPKKSRRVKQRLWRSEDHGATWSYLSDIAVSPNHEPGWEPELMVTADGWLAAYYSDESERAAHDQKLVQVRTRDGVHWSEPEDLIAYEGDRFVRPGMVGVRRMPDGSFFMVYEVCNNDLLRLCGVYWRTSPDGWDWGDPADIGTQVITVHDRYPRHTPTITIADGAVVLASEMLVEADGRHAPGNGATLMINRGDGAWHEFPAPVAVHGVNNEGCRNFSPSLLASPEGDEVLEVTSDLEEGVCKTYYATGPIPLGQPGAR
ncbi:sialidase family protein [Actinokineospora soli]